MSDQRLYIAPGDLRTDLLGLFDDADSEIDILLTPPGHLREPFDGYESVADTPASRLPSKSAFAFRQGLFDEFRDGLDKLPQTRQQKQLIERWVERLRAGEVRVFLYAGRPRFTRLICRPDGSVAFNGPLTDERSKQSDDLSFKLRGDEHRKARRWFEEHREKAEDVSDEFQQALVNSWAGPFVDPEDLYYKVLVEYFWQTIEGLDVETDDNPMVDNLTQFQEDAYEYAKGILRRYGGVFLADVVGLGKTFIGLALLKFLQMRYGEHAVVIAPPKVCPQWDTLAAEFRIELQTVSHGKLEDLEQYRDREVLLIDESHNFRNTDTLRYETVMEWLRPDGASSSTKCILLSATPQNNRPEDVKHQLAFFPDNYARLPYPGGSLDAFFDKVRHGEASLNDLLQHVVVRRTRRFIKSAYPDATLRKRIGPDEYTEVPLEFPERVSGPEQCLRYSIADAYGGEMYEHILSVLRGMNYAIYGLRQYVLPEHEDRPELTGIRQAGRSIRGLFKVLMLKRLESSIHAFRISLENLLGRLEAALDRLESGLVQVRAEETDNPDEVASAGEDERNVTANWFDRERLRQDIEEDLESVRQLLSEMEQVRPEQDAKLHRLRSYLAQRSPTEHRTIVFTQFTDTAEYLARELDQDFGRTDMVTGSSGNALKIARRFAPKANRVEEEIDASDEIDLLISTDALSEGVNLQDADTLVNYDLHWNPLRLIQRAGRIDRIGSENDEIHISSFLPEKRLEDNLGLESVLRRRIEDFLDVFGEDSRILPSEEKPDKDEMLSAFTGEALEEAEQQDDELDGLSRHSDRLLNLRRNNPDRYNRVLGLRPGRRACSDSGLQKVAATNMGWYWRFWVENEQGKPIKLSDDQEGLDLLYEHATAGESRPEASELERISSELGEFVEEARERFVPEADRVRQQRQRPELSSTEQFLLDSLEDYKRQCLASERPLVEKLIEWVKAGYAQGQLRRTCRQWKTNNLPPQTVFNELRVLHERHPPVDEDLGEPMVVGAATGKDDS